VRLAAASLLIGGCSLVDLSAFDSSPDAAATGGPTKDGASVSMPDAADEAAVQDESSLDARADGTSATESSVAPNEAAAQVEASEVMEASGATLPDGAVHDIPAGYTGMPFEGIVAQIPGTIYVRNYDTGGQGVAFSHPGAINCSDWPNGMPMYRTGADCVGLSVEDSQAPDVVVDGGPADYGEIYLSWCSSGEWLKYTVEVLESGTYGISITNAGPAATVLLSFSAMPAVTTGNLTVPQSVDQADSGPPSYHVWQNVNGIGKIDLPAGVYVMQFSIVYTAANFDSFTFTKM
jgi:hypothetical protein